MYILGISAYYHDSAACLIFNDEIIAAAQEERFTRKKQDASFPEHAIQYCLKEAGITLDELTYIAFYDKPFLKFERLLETYYAFAPKGVLSFVRSIPVWIKEKLFLKSELKKNLSNIGPYDQKKVQLVFPEHHLSHAASAYYPSPFNQAAIITLDGVGEWATAGIFQAFNGEIKILKQLNFPHSIGLLYSAFTYYLGFKVNSGEYKLMGMAPYGSHDSARVNQFKAIIKQQLVSIKDDGSIWMNPKYFSYATGMRMIPDKQWSKLFGFSRRESESPIEQHHSDLALAIQEVTEEIVLKIVEEAKRLTKMDHLCLAGGVALNCVANGKILKSKVFSQVYIQPAAGDAGGALGAAFASYHIIEGNDKKQQSNDLMKGAYLGPRFSDLDIEYVARSVKASFTKYEDFEELTTVVAKAISEANAVGWFQGRMEFGPRALGNRSILGDPRNPEMQLKLNLKIKYRESFRPFAPSVLAEDVNTYFELKEASPYMLLVDRVASDQLANLPEDYESLGMRDKLYVKRSTIPSITHVDQTARIQTVTFDTNPEYYALIKKFKELTGLGMLINTSFNVRGEPIVCNPHDAMQCFIHTEMDVLVLNNYVFWKKDQSFADVKHPSERNFDLD